MRPYITLLVVLCILTPLWPPASGTPVGDSERLNSEPIQIIDIILDSEQLDKSELFPVTHLPVHFINSEQLGVSEQFCDDQKCPYHQVFK